MTSVSVELPAGFGHEAFDLATNRVGQTGAVTVEWFELDPDLRRCDHEQLVVVGHHPPELCVGPVDHVRARGEDRGRPAKIAHAGGHELDRRVLSDVVHRGTVETPGPPRRIRQPRALAQDHNWCRR